MCHSLINQIYKQSQKYYIEIRGRIFLFHNKRTVDSIQQHNHLKI